MRAHSLFHLGQIVFQSCLADAATVKNNLFIVCFTRGFIFDSYKLFLFSRCMEKNDTCVVKTDNFTENNLYTHLKKN